MGTIFGDRTSFETAEFRDHTLFEQARFGNQAIFRKAKFDNALIFKNTRFTGEVVFQDIMFERLNSKTIVNFTNVNFEKPNLVYFHNVDLRSFALVKSNVQEINFLDCDWPKTGKRRFAVFDEVYYSEKNKNQKDQDSWSFLDAATLGEIEQLYLRLQTNFENNKYAGAGDFYIGAMEMRRLQFGEKSNKVWRLMRQNIFSLIAWYRKVSLYGERYAKSLIWMLIVIFLFPMFYLLVGFNYPETNPPNEQYSRVNYSLGEIGEIMNYSQITED